MPKLIIHEEGECKTREFDGSITLGRGANATVKIADRLASRLHCRIEKRGDLFQVQDVGSQNGTFVNGAQVLAADLRPGDLISIGNARIFFDREPDPLETGVVSTPGAQGGADLVKRLTRERSNLIRLQRIAHALSTESDLDSLLSIIVDSLIELSGADRGFLILRDKKTEDWTFATARNFEGEQVPEPELAISRSIANRVLETGKSVLSVNAREDEEWENVQSISNLGLRSVLAVPLNAHGEMIGVAYVDHRMAKGVFDEDDLRLAESFGSQAATAVLRARLLKELRAANKELSEGRERIRILNEELKKRVAVQEVELVEARARLRERAAVTGNDYSRLIGRSKAMLDVFRVLDRVVSSDFPVQIYGESGTGKELVARAIHENGPRAKARFVSENCAALPDSLLESELFGHVKGAFTGASANKKGLLQVAHCGTLFLDEVGDMSLELQKKLLRFLQEGEFRPVGGREPVHVDVRVISASNKDLRDLEQQGRFREDLFYRLNVLPIRLPPLRERKDDIPLLLDHFLKHFCLDSNRPVMRMRPEVIDALVAYSWPGNVRELENETRMLITFADDPITLDRLSERIRCSTPDRETEISGDGLMERVEALERREIKQALEDSGGNKSRAADILKISRFTLQRKLEKYHMLPEAIEGDEGALDAEPETTQIEALREEEPRESDP